MKLQVIRQMYDHSGPFASVYLDASRTTEVGAEEVELRWRDIRRKLAREHTHDDDLDAIEEVVTDPEEAAPGLAVFAVDGDVAHDEAMSDPPALPIATWSALPHVMPLLAQRGESVPQLRVIIDHTGADVIVIGPGSPRRTAVHAQEWPLTKTAQGGWSQKRYERSVEETWERNAMAVAAEVDEEVRRIGAELVVVAGEPRSRAMLLDHLGAEASARVVVAERGSRAEGADPAPFEAEAEAAVDAWGERELGGLLDRYGAGPSARGLDDPAAALRDGRVEVLLLAADSPPDGQMWIGREGPQLALTKEELAKYGVPDPVRERADAALVRAAATTDADLWFAARDDLGTEVAAVLRF
ncbi:Vms1/Ankzf1 family peptidyl-tRNA hydrolase [Spongiactinospora sp. TRM90649]|uniref:baeRF2 domain-containing protein n=1 Tax=Spongiactinospora sp. TRM90649 TaxID=3031114 RepID=UPI0023F61A12|nr:Vms1/Ankzf1 family peptidyl-tRNA hydrolase [Spongiactinospora sp. TRM90649]MDF5758695.1 Vms1/Ankzf1 family peptidyl-tRNA hydrolase [Spongiactinospora sp. TRM90649]